VQPVLITSANAAQLKQANLAPASNVQAMDWSADSATLGLVSQNQDSSGNAVFSATLLDGRSLAVKTVWAAPDGGRITRIGPDGRLAAVISADARTATLYDLGDGDRDVVEITPGYLVGGVTFSPDGKYFTITDYDDMKVSLHNLPDGSEYKVLAGFQTAAPVFDVGFLGNSASVVWHARAQIQLQDVETGTLGPSFEHEDFVSAMALSADGKVLASAAGKTINGNFQPAVTLWDTASGNVLQTLVLPQTALGLSFSPDGSLLAVATGNDVQIWNAASGVQLTTLSGHSAPVNLVAFSPDGKSLASSAQDNQLILWQVLQ
jgi:WD40 repeat protein